MSARPLVLEMEAVLSTEQLSDVRWLVENRLHGIPVRRRADVVLVADELCSAVLEQRRLCCGLRVYSDGATVRVEVDEPWSGNNEAPQAGVKQLVISTVADRWGVTTQLDGRPGGGRTLWCELGTEESR